MTNINTSYYNSANNALNQLEQGNNQQFENWFYDFVGQQTQGISDTTPNYNGGGSYYDQLCGMGLTSGVIGNMNLNQYSPADYNYAMPSYNGGGSYYDQLCSMGLTSNVIGNMNMNQYSPTDYNYELPTYGGGGSYYDQLCSMNLVNKTLHGNA
ncbi:MAG: hypothetical protein AB1782_04560 [Cyanobacteriota bacterium]